MTDYWKYVKPDPRGLEDNPYINPPKDRDSRENPSPEPPRTGAVGTIGTVDDVASDFITFENIVCVDSKGTVIEKYDALQVRKDVERKPDGTHTRFNAYAAGVHFESKGLFLPSFALSCNILAVLYANRNDADVRKVLMQYKDYGPEYGWHAQNTLVNWGAKQVIHYPNKTDYTGSGGNTVINAQSTRKPIAFNNTGFNDMLLEDALRNKDYKEFVQNLTGLAYPEILIEIGSYFGKPAKSWVSSDNKTRATWLGCSGGDFGIGTSYCLDGNYAARGVRSSPR